MIVQLQIKPGFSFVCLLTLEIIFEKEVHIL